MPATRYQWISVSFPPLRERESDIELLLNHFLAGHARRIGRDHSGVSKEVLHLLCRYRWPGNVRELSNLVEYLLNIVPEGEMIDSSLLPPVFHPAYTHALSADVISKARQRSNCQSASMENSDTDLSNLKSVKKKLTEEALQRTRDKKGWQVNLASVSLPYTGRLKNRVYRNNPCFKYFKWQGAVRG